MRRVSLIFIGYIFIGCNRGIDGDKIAIENLLSQPAPKSLKLINQINGGTKGFIAFYRMSKADFDTFRANSTKFADWKPLERGITIDAAGRALRIPEDIDGLYATGLWKNGLMEILVWNAKCETLAILNATGIL